MVRMALWKWLICVTFFAVVLSDEAPQVSSSLNIANTDFAKILPNQDKLRAIAEKFITATEREQIAILNDYTDDLLPHLNRLILNNALDPTPMPDIVEEFEWRVILIVYRGIMSLTNGWLQGLGTFNRQTDVTVRYQYPNIKIRLPLRFDTLLFDYQYKAQFMGLGPTGGVDGKVEGCRWTLDLNINLVTLRAELERYHLDSLGSVSLKFSGNVLVDWMVNIFVSVTIPFVKPVIKFVVEGFINGGLEAVLNYYNTFICTLLADCPTEEFVNVVKAVPVLLPSLNKASL